MFTISVYVSGETIYGLDALDYARQVGLEDSTVVHIPDLSSKRVEVDEGFARLHFGRTDVHMSRLIKRQYLSKGELIKLENGSLKLQLTDDRVKELWIAHKNVQ